MGKRNTNFRKLYLVDEDHYNSLHYGQVHDKQLKDVKALFETTNRPQPPPTQNVPPQQQDEPMDVDPAVNYPQQNTASTQTIGTNNLVPAFVPPSRNSPLGGAIRRIAGPAIPDLGPPLQPRLPQTNQNTNMQFARFVGPSHSPQPEIQLPPSPPPVAPLPLTGPSAPLSLTAPYAPLPLPAPVAPLALPAPTGPFALAPLPQPTPSRVYALPPLAPTALPGVFALSAPAAPLPLTGPAAPLPLTGPAAPLPLTGAAAPLHLTGPAAPLPLTGPAASLALTGPAAPLPLTGPAAPLPLTGPAAPLPLTGPAALLSLPAPAGPFAPASGMEVDPSRGTIRARSPDTVGDNGSPIIGHSVRRRRYQRAIEPPSAPTARNDESPVRSRTPQPTVANRELGARRRTYQRVPINPDEDFLRQTSRGTQQQRPDVVWFFCQICKTSFRTENSLRKHVERIHKEDWEQTERGEKRDRGDKKYGRSEQKYKRID